VSIRALPLLVFATLVPLPRAFAQGPVLKDLVYATGVPTEQGPIELKLDLYQPVGVPGPWPVVVWIHGGGWTSGSKESATGATLVQNGFAVASIDYRLSQQAVWPAQIQDVKGAVRWLRANATALGIDADRIGAWGSSAGGHLAAFLATSGDVGVVQIGGVAFDLEGDTGGNLDRSSRIQAVVDWYGPTDFLEMSQYPSDIDHEAAGSPESRLVGGAISTLPAHVAAADPARFLSRDDPPMLIQHGTHDLSVPFAQSERLFERALRGFGVDARFVPVVDGGHGGPGFVAQPAREFFDEHLGSTPDTVVSVTALGALPEAGGGAGAFRLSRTGPVDAPLVVGVDAGGTAEELADFEALGAAVVIPALASSVDVTPVVLQDALVEGNESLALSLVASDAYGIAPAAARAVLVLQDDDAPFGLPLVAVHALDASASGAGDGGAFTITRLGSTAAEIAVAYRLEGDARNGVDFALLDGIAVLPSGASSAVVPVDVLDDDLGEPTESVELRLVAGEGYALGLARSSVVAIADDEPFPRLNLAREFDAVEGAPGAAGSDGVILASRTDAGPALVVPLAASGSAGAGDVVAPTSVAFAAGERVVHVPIAVLDDAASEGEERLALTLQPVAGYSLGLAAERAIAVLDDDAPVPADAPTALEVGVLRSGRAASATTVGEPGAIHALLASPAPGYAAIGPYPLLLAPGALFALDVGVLPPSGVATLAALLPATVVGGEVRMQAATLGGDGVWRASRVRVRNVVVD